MKFSLIIPVYNVAPYLPDCIDSCLNQQTMTLGQDYEIIFVNDGSTDNSLQVLEDRRSTLPAAMSGGVYHCKSTK